MSKFTITEEERKRILRMHVEATKRHYGLVSEQQSEYTCKSENINVTDNIQIRLSPNQEMGDSKSATPNVVLKNFRTIGGSRRTPLVYIQNLKPQGTATNVEVKQGYRHLKESDNIWLSKVEYVKLTDKTTKNSVYFPSFLTLTHMFCAKFKNPETMGEYIDLNSAEPGTQVYNYYRIPIISKGTLTIDTLVSNGLDFTGLLSNRSGILAQTFAVSKLSNILPKIFGEGYVTEGINPEVFKTISEIIVTNQPKTK